MSAQIGGSSCCCCCCCCCGGAPAGPTGPSSVALPLSPLEARGETRPRGVAAPEAAAGFSPSVALAGARREQRLDAKRLRRARLARRLARPRSLRRTSRGPPCLASPSPSPSPSPRPPGKVHAPQRREVEPGGDHRHRRHRPARPRPRREHRGQLLVVGVVEPPLVVDLLARRGQDHDRGLERALLGLDPPGDAVAGLDLGAGHGPGAQEVLELVAAEGVAWAIDWNRGRG